MIYIRVKNELGASVGAYKNVWSLRKRIQKQFVSYNGKTLKEHLEILNAERITMREYHKAIGL